MKTIKNVQLIFLMLIALNVFGFNTNPKNVLTSTSADQCEQVNVYLKSAKGKTLHHEILNSCDGLPEQFEWSELADGSYSLEYDLEMEIKVVPMLVQDSKVEFKPSYKKFIPVVHNRGDLLYITRLAFESQNMNISIYDSSNELLYKETIRNSNLKGRIFDISQIQDDEINVVVKANGRTYTKTILM